MRVLLVDDEPLALRRLAALLGDIEGVEVVGEAGDGEEALRLAPALRPDLALLDIQMPGPSGLEVARALNGLGVEVIFATAFSDRAVEAFALDAIDYLLKPIAADRLAEAVRRAARRRQGRSPGAPAPSVTAEAAVPEASGPAGVLDHFWVRQKDGHVRVPVADIQRIESDRDYVLLHTPWRSHVVRATMNELERKLPPAELARVHRSAFVRLAAVERVESHRRTSMRLHLKDGAIVEVGPSYAAGVLAALGVDRSGTGS